MSSDGFLKMDETWVMDSISNHDPDPLREIAVKVNITYLKYKRNSSQGQNIVNCKFVSSVKYIKVGFYKVLLGWQQFSSIEFHPLWIPCLIYFEG